MSITEGLSAVTIKDDICAVALVADGFCAPVAAGGRRVLVMVADVCTASIVVTSGMVGL